MNVRFERYLETLTPKQKNLACEAVAEYMKGDIEEETIIRDSKDVYNACRHYALWQEEHSAVLLLKTNGSLIKEVELCTGTCRATMFDVQAVIREAILAKAQAVIMVHNHPSGSKRATPQDDDITRRVQKACEVMDIRLNDHVIICNGDYYSYAEEGKL